MAPGILEPWLEEVREVHEQSFQVLLDLPVLPVNGTVTKGGQGVRGKLELAPASERTDAPAVEEP